jgi:hypothetical protein
VVFSLKKKHRDNFTFTFIIAKTITINSDLNTMFELVIGFIIARLSAASCIYFVSGYCDGTSTDAVEEYRR